MGLSLEVIFDDVLIHVFGMLSLKDVLSIRQTSKRFKAITNFRAIWHDQFRFEVLSKGLPIPGTAIPLQQISALDLEWRTRLAVRIQKMWMATPTRPLRSVLHRSIPAAQQAALRIGGCELFTLHMGRLITWRINGTKELAADNIIHQQSLGIDSTWKIYKDHGGSGTIAIANSSGEDVFIFEGSFDDLPLQRHYPGRVLGLFHHFILISTSTEFGATIDIYNWASTSLGSATIQSDDFLFGKLIAFAGFDSHLLVFRETCLEIYPSLTLPEEGQSTTLRPIQAFFLPFPIQSPVVCSPCAPPYLPDSGLALPPNSKHAKAFFKSICYQIAGTLEIRGSILTRNTDSEAVNAPPFRLVRNPSITTKDCTCMRFGHSGRGLWLDSHNNVFRCNTVSMVTPGGGEYPTLDMGQRSLTPLCTLPGVLKDHDGDWALDFDEGMCRIVYCNEAGLVAVMDVV